MNRVLTRINYDPSIKRPDPSPPPKRHETLWTPAEDQTLTDLWHQGLSAIKIARELPGRTCNMVISRRRRLKLPGRPSPIKRAS